MKKSVFWIVSGLLVCMAVPAIAGPSIGEITFVTGDISIIRNGAVIQASRIGIGDTLENYDLIRTGSRGKMECTITTPQRQRVRLKIDANTAFTVELSKLSNGGEQTSLEMVSGTVALNVSPLTGNNSVQVRTRTAAMGVRGTNFRVSTAPTEDLLVTCDEGKVFCTDEAGKSLFAEPGAVVEKIADSGAFSTYKVTPEEIDRYSQGWIEKRLELFKANASRAIVGFATRFEAAWTKVAAAYQELLQKKPIIDKWMEQDKQNQAPQTGEVLTEKRQIIGTLFKAKAALVIFDRIYFRLLELEYYFSQGYGSGDVKPGQTIKQFFTQLDAKKADIERVIANIKYVMKLYALRNGGYFPVDAMGLSGDSMFDNGGSFFD